MTKLWVTGVSSSLLCGLVALAACSPGSQPAANTPTTPPVDHRAADEAAIRTTDSAWVNAVASKDTGKILAFYSTDATVFEPNTPLVVGKDEIRKMWAAEVAMSGMSLTFVPLKIVVMGDVAYEVGDYHFSAMTKSGRHLEKGKYVVVWGRQPDGSWKVLVDAPTTTQ